MEYDKVDKKIEKIKLPKKKLSTSLYESFSREYVFLLLNASIRAIGRKSAYGASHSSSIGM